MLFVFAFHILYLRLLAKDYASGD